MLYVERNISTRSSFFCSRAAENFIYLC